MSPYYTQLSTHACELMPPVDINKLTMANISDFMKAEYDPKRLSPVQTLKNP